MSSIQNTKVEEHPFYRQGDVFLRRVDEEYLKRYNKGKVKADFLKTSKVLEKAKPYDSNVVAYGEVTGHKHQFRSTQQQLELVSSPEALLEGQIQGQQNLYAIVKAPAELEHEEHGSHTIHPGIYAITIKRQYNPYKKIIEKVMD